MFKQNLSGNQEAPLILGCNNRQVQRYNLIINKAIAAIIHEQLLCNVEIMCTCRSKLLSPSNPSHPWAKSRWAARPKRQTGFEIALVANPSLLGHFELVGSMKQVLNPLHLILESLWNHGPSPSNLGIFLCVVRPTHIHDMRQKSPRNTLLQIWDLVSMSDFKIKVCESMHW